MNTKFFEKLYYRIDNNEISCDILLVIDWLFDDRKFELKCTKEKLTKFIKTVKKFDSQTFNNNYKYDAIKNLKFPTKIKRNVIIHSNGQSESKDLVRHIRNAIGHNNAKIYNYHSVYYFEGIDYKKDGKSQTAYINIKIEILLKIFKTFKIIMK